MTSTSREAYNAETKSGRTGKTQLRVLRALAEAKCSASGREIEKHLGLPGCWKRLSELEKAGLIERAGTRKCGVSGKRVTVWRLIREEW